MRTIHSKAEYEQLCDEIWHHDRCYFQEAAPEISDEEYDALVRLLESVEKEHPDWVSPTSPTSRLGEKPLEGFQEVTHAEPMLSLEKAFEKEELEAFYTRVCKLIDREKPLFFGEVKMDGLAISVTYEHGRLVRAVTRGDGKVGSDITNNFKTIRGIPLRIPSSHEILEVRGEIYLPKESFERLNAEREKEGLPVWANPRNAAAGSIKLLDSRELAKREGLSCVFYGVARQQPVSISFQHEVVDFLHSLGLPTYLSMKKLPLPPFSVIKNLDEMMEFQAKILRVRESLPFGIDGVVFKLDSLDETASIPPTMKHPRTAIAWKFKAERVWTTLKEIVVQVGRTGVITPVAELDPVEVSGSVISRATLHNAEEIERKDIRPGDRVLIEKGGDVIPKIVESDHSMPHRKGMWKMPTTCPSCGSLLVKVPGEVAWRCVNHSSCQEQLIKKLVHFVGKEGLDVEHVGEKLIRNLFLAEIVRRPFELFTVTREQLLTLEGIKEKAAENILRGIEAAKKPTFESFLLALGIRYVGAGTAARLAHHAQNIEKLFSITQEELLNIDGIGEEVAHSIREHFSDPLFCEDTRKLLEVGVIPQVRSVHQGIPGHPFNGKTIVLTGTLTSMTRTEASKKIEACGGSTSETVTKKTDFVVAGEKPGSKLEKAKKLGITVLHEEEFIESLQTN